MKRIFRRVVIESPFGAPTAEGQSENLRYLRACMRDCLDRGEAPFASHGLYTQEGVLDDWDPAEREKGIQAGFEWRAVAHATIVYADRGITPGMRAGLRKATELQEGGVFDHSIEYRFLGGEWSALGGPEEIRRHLEGLLAEEPPKHRHLALVTGPASKEKHVRVLPTPGELSMEGVARRAEDGTIVTTVQDEVAHAKPFLRLEKPNGPRMESYRDATAPLREPGGLLSPEVPLSSDPRAIDEDFFVPVRPQCPEWIRWKPHQGMLDGQCVKREGHSGDHEYDSKPCPKDPPLCTCAERPDPDWNGKHEDDCPWLRWDYARLVHPNHVEEPAGPNAPLPQPIRARPSSKSKKAPACPHGRYKQLCPECKDLLRPENMSPMTKAMFEGEFGEGESFGGHGPQTDDYGMEYQDPSPAPSGRMSDGKVARLDPYLSYKFPPEEKTEEDDVPDKIQLRGRTMEVGKEGWLYCREHNTTWNVAGTPCGCVPGLERPLTVAEVEEALKEGAEQRKAAEKLLKRWPRR